MLGRTDNHVFKINPILKPPLIFRKDWFEDFEKCEASRRVSGTLAAASARLDGETCTFEVSQESSERLRERIDPSQLRELVKYQIGGDRIGCSKWGKLFCERLDEPPLDAFVAICFDERGPMVFMDRSFPRHAF